MNRAGSGIATANARDEVKSGVGHVTKNPGGGAVREVASLLRKYRIHG